MRTIEIDEDIYEYLRGHVSDFGETPSSVLRRLLGIDPPAPPPGPPPNPDVTQPDRLPRTPVPQTPPPEEIAAPVAPGVVAIAPEDLEQANTAIARMKVVLSRLYQRHGAGFAAVEDIQGRIRNYFSRDRRELLAAGHATNPEAIPDTPYYVITNLPNDGKRRILDQVLRVLDYPAHKRNDILRLLDRDILPRSPIVLGSPTTTDHAGPEHQI